ncbi:Trafficking protein particle complex subunit [Plasmodiophora brassicae]|uniref:Trafficking protein particle complex subunit n=1 Tax=Plasmodiophora brassicae TaxID=37360 RepID=A0A0G4J4N4_PLABS|nr:hypothetical protein PBRA_008908 [Plasmodiophora brassicae]SPQ93747.1 unnamed protein product [Plasmodiophora brassicae]
MSTESEQLRLGEALLNKAESVTAELFSLTYGAFVVQLLQDERDDVVEVNRILDRIGFNIGQRIVDDFLVQTGIGTCKSLKDTADLIGRVAFKMFLGVSAGVQNWSADGSSFTLVLPGKGNPLTEFVELPDAYAGLNMCDLLCGVIRGALDMVQIRVEASVVKDALKGDDATEIRVVRKGIVKEEYNPNED